MKSLNELEAELRIREMRLIEAEMDVTRQKNQIACAILGEFAGAGKPLESVKVTNETDETEGELVVSYMNAAKRPCIAYYTFTKDGKRCKNPKYRYPIMTDGGVYLALDTLFFEADIALNEMKKMFIVRE